MSREDEIIRIAAKGDGVTASGRFVAGAAPGDVLQGDGSLRWGEHHVEPPCRHFALRPAQGCGGCQLQHLDDESLAAFVTERVVGAAAGQGLVPERIMPPHLSPPHSRRRASLVAQTSGGRVMLGFHEAGSHKLVDLAECPVLTPALAALIAPLRKLLARIANLTKQGRLAVEVELTLADQGVDLALKGLAVEGLAATEAMLDFAREQALARLVLDQGYGREALWEPEPLTITLSGVAVPLPSGAFLQASADGEAALVAAARDWLGECPTVADLFSGLGTFAFALAGPKTKVLAAEAARDATQACKAAAARAQRPVHALHRDLFRGPLMPDELSRFAAILLDPPRAGARAQVERIAASEVKRVVYISCNPSSWARDGAVLAAAGFRLAELRPVGQFRWSTHVELASLFVR